MSDAGPPEPVTIPPQEDFPVEWASADEQKIPWELDLMHFNNVMPPLEAEFWAQFMHGADLAMQHFEMPLQMVGKPFNYWLYTGIFPRIPPEQMAEQTTRSDEVLMANVGRLQERWDEEWLPEIKKHIEEWDAFDVAAASSADLQTHLTEVWAGALRLADIHFQIVFPVYIALSLLDDLYNDLFSDGVFESQKLVQGFDNKTLEVGRALWDLSRKAKASDGVREIFEEHAPGDVMNALVESDDGQALVEEVDAFLNLSDALGKFFGAPVGQNDAAEDTVAGNAGSSGKVRGTARVVRSLDEADKLGVGEILVAESTSPSWTPLFGIAAGLVTDTGGILSHCAVVAREYGIPAVVGTGVATSMITDGQTIEVDGDAGRVYLID